MQKQKRSIYLYWNVKNTKTNVTAKVCNLNALCTYFGFTKQEIASIYLEVSYKGEAIIEYNNINLQVTHGPIKSNEEVQKIIEVLFIKPNAAPKAKPSLRKERPLEQSH